jgi:hypothetical protein
MPVEEPARTTVAVRRALPDLVRLNRYESCASETGPSAVFSRKGNKASDGL